MSPETKHFFRFGTYHLDVDQRVLLCDGQPVQLTPKAFLLLQALVENHGRIVEKEQLMSAAWANSFVEEGNLSFTMNRLRKALGDDPQKPVFIETVPRRGYRFVAPVTTQSEEEASSIPDLPDHELVAPTVISRRSGVRSLRVAAALVLLIGIVGIGSWYSRGVDRPPKVPVLAESFNSESLSTDGRVNNVVVSPNGKSVVYTSGFKDKQSVWHRQLETSSNVPILPPSDDVYLGLAFAPDGNSLYFARKPKYVEKQADIYRVSIYGGVPVQVVRETQGWMSVSPDGSKLSFVRCEYREEESCSLWIADSADGKNERKLASRKSPLRIGDNKISPDGKTVAFAVGQSRNDSNEFSLLEIDLDTGSERELTSQKFFNIKGLAWLPDQAGLLITASRSPSRTFRVWQVTPGSPQVQALTNDSETYSTLSLNTEASILAATKIKPDFRLQVYSTAAPTAVTRVLADATTAAFAPDGKIIFSSSMTGSANIWSIDPDGGEMRQLTNDTSMNSIVTVSPDGGSIFYTSNRSGAAHIWQISTDGSDQKQITTNEGGFPIRVCPDGKWLYYNSALSRTLWRVDITTAAEELVSDQRSNHVVVSPDCSQAAFPDSHNNLKVVSINGGQTLATFKLPHPRSNLTGLVWSPDDKFLAYTLADGEFHNNTLWFQPLDSTAARQVADLGTDQIFEISGFAMSPDGKAFAVVKGGWRHDAVLLRGLN